MATEKIQVRVNNKCITCMTCVQTVPTVFKFDGSQVTGKYDGRTDLETLKRTQMICPVSAIEIYLKKDDNKS